jgi:prepilin-type N-terminal cleavage/methylation domain-containing protein
MMRKKQNQNQGFSLIELLVVVAIILVIVAIAVPSMLAAKRSANASAAAGTVRTLSTAAAEYVSSFPAATGGAAANLTSIGVMSGAAPCAPAVATGCEIDPAWVVGTTRNGYQFTVVQDTADLDGWVVNAAPVASGTGVPAFCSDRNLTIHIDSAGVGGSTSTVCEGFPVLGSS